MREPNFRPMAAKWCPGCKQAKPRTEFWFNRATADGYNTYCKPCWLPMRNARRRRQVMREREELRARRRAAHTRVTTPEWHWLAGLLEGEGCFSLIHDKMPSTGGERLRPRVFIGMTDEDVVMRVLSLTDVGTVVRTEPRKAHWKPQFRWTVQVDADAAAVMMTVYPLMATRRRARIREVLTAWRET